MTKLPTSSAVYWGGGLRSSVIGETRPSPSSPSSTYRHHYQVILPATEALGCPADGERSYPTNAAPSSSSTFSPPISDIIHTVVIHSFKVIYNFLIFTRIVSTRRYLYVSYPLWYWTFRRPFSRSHINDHIDGHVYASPYADVQHEYTNTNTFIQLYFKHKKISITVSNDDNVVWSMILPECRNIKCILF